MYRYSPNNVTDHAVAILKDVGIPELYKLFENDEKYKNVVVEIKDIYPNNRDSVSFLALVVFERIHGDEYDHEMFILGYTFGRRVKYMICEPNVYSGLADYIVRHGITWDGELGEGGRVDDDQD
jgi:hypothetical protein